MCHEKQNARVAALGHDFVHCIYSTPSDLNLIGIPGATKGDG